MAETTVCSKEEMVEREQVTKAVKALCQYVEKKGEEQIDAQIEDNDVQLQLNFRRIPRTKNIKIKVGLPTSLVRDTTDVCLFVKDLDKKDREHEATSRHYKELLASKGVSNITEIIPLKSLKLEYQPHEAKRNLSNMYDMYLADARIVRLLPSQLGKHFYGRKRYPMQVNLEAKDLEKEFKKAFHTTQCVITGKGSTCLTKVGQIGQTEAQLTDNVMAAMETLSEKIPGGRDNIHSLHLKTQDSPAIPLYVCFTSGEGIKLPAKPKAPPLEEPEDVSTVVGAKVRITRKGGIEVIPCPEEGDMDTEALELDTENSKPKGKKSRAGRKRKAKAEALEKKAEENTEEESAPEEVKEEPEETISKATKVSKKVKRGSEAPSAKKARITEEKPTGPKKAKPTKKKQKLSKA